MINTTGMMNMTKSYKGLDIKNIQGFNPLTICNCFALFDLSRMMKREKKAAKQGNPRHNCIDIVGADTSVLGN